MLMVTSILRDIETINIELMFADMELLERRLERSSKAAKGNKEVLKEVDLINQLLKYLEEGKTIRCMNFPEEDYELIKSYNLLSFKPVIYVANIDEADLLDGGNNVYVNQVREYVKEEDAEVIAISAEIEEEISQLDNDEKIEFLNELGLENSGLDKQIQASYKLLGLISFLTTGPTETRAWTIKKGTSAPKAAGKIHTDIERGFIRAETISYDDLVSCGNMVAAKEKGLVRIEGKDYIMQDGDVVLFRFNV